MADGLTAIIACNDNTFFGPKLKAQLEERGYEVYVANGFIDLWEEIGNKDYNLYLMDLNLDMPGRADITPAIRAYRHEKVQERINNGYAAFMGFSTTSAALGIAESQDIPHKHSDYFDKTYFSGTLDKITAKVLPQYKF